MNKDGTGPGEAPSLGRPIATFRKSLTEDKKQFLRDVIGVELRVGDGPSSKDLLKRLVITPNGRGGIFDGSRLFVKKGRVFGLTENKKLQPKVDEFKNLLRKAENERGLPTVDINPKETSDIPGLTDQENRELRGVFNPESSVERSSRIGDDGALQIQADHLQKNNQ